MKTIEGDLIELAQNGHFNMILHGCNCKNIMEAGIAKQIKKTFPEAYQTDTFSYKNAFTELGTLSVAIANKEESESDITIVNLYTQLYPGRCASYDAIDKSLKYLRNLMRDANYSDYQIGYPAIGCGIGGLHWPAVKEIINHRLNGLDHTFVKYKP